MWQHWGAESAATYNCFVYFCQQMTFCFFSGFLVLNARCSCLIAGMGHGWRQKNSGVYICWDRMGMVGDMWGLLVQTYFTAIYLSEEIWHCLSHDTCLFRAVYFQLFHSIKFYQAEDGTFWGHSGHLKTKKVSFRLPLTLFL